MFYQNTKMSLLVWGTLENTRLKFKKEQYQNKMRPELYPSH